MHTTIFAGRKNFKVRAGRGEESVWLNLFEDGEHGSSVTIQSINDDSDLALERGLAEVRTLRAQRKAERENGRVKPEAVAVPVGEPTED